MRNEREQELVGGDGSFDFTKKKDTSDAWFDSVKEGDVKINKKLETKLY